MESGFDQFRRLEVREKIKHVFVMSLSLSDHQGMTQHRIINFFNFAKIFSLFSLVFGSRATLALLQTVCSKDRQQHDINTNKQANENVAWLRDDHRGTAMLFFFFSQELNITMLF